MALTQWQLKPVATDSIASGDFLAFTDEGESGDPINKITIDNLATFLAGGSNLSASAGVLTATDTNTTYTAASNGGIGLSGTAFSLDIDGMTDIGAGIASGDLFIIDDGAGGANRKTTVDRIATLLAGTGLTASSGVISVDAAQTGITSVGALNVGSITSGFTSIDVGSGGITTTGAIAGGTIDASTDFTIGDTVITDGVITDTSGISIAANVSLADDKVITLGEAGKIDFGDEAPDDNEATGIVFSFIAGATLAIGDVVYIHTDGEVAKADADAVTSMPAVGICVSAGSDGSAVDVLVQGIMHDTSAFDTFTVGADIFVSATAGAVTATAPSGSGDTVQKVGVALHADMVYFNFNTTEVLLA